MKSFDVPTQYRGSIISAVKHARRVTDPRKKDLTPATLDFGPVRFKIARHFGFCYGVENAIEIAYRTVEENQGRRVFLLSEMIHNPHVNADLQAKGVQFLRTTKGETLIPFGELTPDDVVIVPAFGASLETMAELDRIGIDPAKYDTTCPFVTKVWKRGDQIARKGYSLVIHGKRYHEETRATFSHAQANAPAVVVLDLAEAEDLATVIRGERDAAYFYERFAGCYSEGFDPDQDLQRIGVINQTTMLATETKAIADLLRQAIVDRYGEEDVRNHFADTRDTLCYATNENQDATYALLKHGADLAIVVGGYNSSNTSHLVELCEEQLPTYFISDAGEIDSPTLIRHFNWRTKELLATANWWPAGEEPLDVILTAGASCPDSLLDEVVQTLTAWYPEARSVEEALEPFV
ncbi:MAG: 4-hydroxy-3-methylbut-2-enyl diphosphate reductase [Bacteroidota bacterium]